MRRVDVKDYTTFMPYCENPNFASGGFVADSRREGGALNGSQQQFYVRNSDLGTGWSNYVWNQVFSGDIAAPAQDFGNGAAYTTLAQTPVSREMSVGASSTSRPGPPFPSSKLFNCAGPRAWLSAADEAEIFPISPARSSSPRRRTRSASSINAAVSRQIQLVVHARRLQRGLPDQGQAG